MPALLDSVTVPPHSLTPDMTIPVVPFFISGHVPPLPSAQRCYALGQAVGRAMLLENPSTYILFEDSTIDEIDFLEAVARRSGCAAITASLLPRAGSSPIT